MEIRLDQPENLCLLSDGGRRPLREVGVGIQDCLRVLTNKPRSMRAEGRSIRGRNIAVV